ncbi:MAG: galactokinase family protein [Bacteroidales bacterium]|nr:galactokinase family protein [Bacteroidales bacterium]
MLINELKSAIDNGATLRSLYGTDEAVINQQKIRYAALADEFVKTYGNKDLTVFSSPGRTEIGGNHTDHNHGRVLAGAVNLDNVAVAATNGTSVVRILSSGYPQFEVDITKLQPNKEEFYTSVGLVRGICARLKELGFEIGGFDAVINSGVPKGSGLSSSASFEVLIGAIVSHLFNGGKLDAVLNAQVGQYAENVFFGKPCGLMDQTACSVGGLVTIDFADPAKPIVKKVDFDFTKTGYALVITDTGGNHADLNDEYASLPTDMKGVAAKLGKTVLREVSLEQVVDAIPALREQKVSDRAILRAIHFERDNARVAEQVADLEKGDFKAFLGKVIASGNSSFMYNQNVYPINNVAEQGLSIALALSDMVLGSEGAWRVHGGGFAGTVQAFVPQHLLNKYVETLEHTFGKGKCHKLFIRPQGSIKVEF